MKIIINATNQIEDRPLREVERLINSGKGHLPEIPFSDYVPNKVEQKIIEEYSEKVGWPINGSLEELKTDEIIFREPEVTEVDVIEPIPMDRYVSFEEFPKTTEKNIKKPKISPKKKQ
ncbi:MAG: hypothetical protein ACYDIA_01770 [Candidatus Humimicrobiaceae bacterium]